MLLRDKIDALGEKVTLPTALRHLRDKTILLVGDSVDRFFVDRFCSEMLGDADIRLSYRALHIKPADLSDISVLHRTAQHKSLDYFAEPHLCELPSRPGGLNFWFLMHYGVLTQDEHEWAFKEQARSPRIATQKVQMFAEQLAASDHQAPDLTSMHSG